MIKKQHPETYVFLPDYIFEAFKHAKLGNNNTLVVKTNVLFQSKSEKRSFNITPLLLFSILAVIIIFITYKDYKNHKRSKWLDFILFFVTGLLGVFMLLLWFATNHTATANNFNILWAFAPNLIVAFYLLNNKLKPWVKYYSTFLILLLLATIIIWVAKVQEFNLAIIPMLIMLSVRYLFLRSKF